MLTVMRAKRAAGRAHVEASDTRHRNVPLSSGGLATGGDNRIIIAKEDRHGTPARVLAAILIGIGLAAIFGSGPALRWTETLPDNRLTAALHDTAARWNEALSPFGVSRPRDWLRAKLRAFEAIHF